MSEGDVAKALETLLKALGAEAARGLVYWATGKAMDNMVVPAIRKLLMGQQLSPSEIDALREALLAQARAQQQMSQQADMDRLAQLVAEKLRSAGLIAQQQPQPAAPQYPQTYAAPAPPVQYHGTANPVIHGGVNPVIETRRQFIRQELENLKRIELELQSMYYREFDETKRTQIAQRLSEVRQKIVELESQLAQLAVHG